MPKAEGMVESKQGGVTILSGPVAAPAPQEAPEPYCSPAQGLLALLALKGLKESDILEAISQIPGDGDRYAAQVAFSRANPWLRNNPTILQLGQLLGLTAKDMDDLFAMAATIEV